MAEGCLGTGIQNGFRNFTLDECKDKYVDLYYWKLKGGSVTHKSVSDSKTPFLKLVDNGT